MVRLNIAIVFVALSSSAMLAYSSTVLSRRQITSNNIPEECASQPECQDLSDLLADPFCSSNEDCLCTQFIDAFESCVDCINTIAPDTWPDGPDKALEQFTNACKPGIGNILSSSTASSSTSSTSVSVASAASASPTSSTTKASSTGSSSDSPTDGGTSTSSGPTNSQIPNGSEALTQNTIHYAVFGAIVLGAMTVL